MESPGSSAVEKGLIKSTVGSRDSLRPLKLNPVEACPHQLPLGLAAGEPATFFLPPYMAHHGWIGIYLDVGSVDWDRVELFLSDAYRLAAPKTFNLQFDRFWICIAELELQNALTMMSSGRIAVPCGRRKAVACVVDQYGRLCEIGN